MPRRTPMVDIRSDKFFGSVSKMFGQGFRIPKMANEIWNQDQPMKCGSKSKNGMSLKK